MKAAVFSGIDKMIYCKNEWARGRNFFRNYISKQDKSSTSNELSNIFNMKKKFELNEGCLYLQKCTYTD